MLKIILFILLIGIGSKSYEQQQSIDSLKRLLFTSKPDSGKVKTLLRLSNSFSVNGDIADGLYYSQWGKELSDTLHWIDGVAAAYSKFGIAYDYAGNWDSAIFFQIKEVSVRRKINNNQRLADALKRLSISYSNKGDYYNACNYLFESTHLDENSNNTAQLGEDYSNLGAMFTDLKLYKLAMLYSKRSLAISKKLNNEVKEAYDFNNLSAVYANLKKNDSALFYINKAVSIFEGKHLYYEEFSCFINLASIYNQLKIFDSALSYIDRCRYSPLFTSNKYMQAITYGAASEICINENNISKAKKYIFKAIELANENHILQQQVIDYQDLTKIYIKDNDIDNAYASFENFLHYNDSFFNKADITTTALSAFIEEKMNSQKLLLTNEVKSSNESKRLWVLFTIGIAILLIAGILIYRKYEQNKTALRVKELQQKALRAQLNPHFIFNAMQSIQREYTTDAQKGEALLVDFSVLIREVLNKSFSFTGTLEEEIELIKKYVDIESQRLTFPLHLTLKIDEDINATHVAFPSLALQPIVENAIKYGAADNNIVINIKANSKLLMVIIKNDLAENNASDVNKPGISYSGVGLQLTKDRINLFNKQYKVKGSVESVKSNTKFITTISLAYITKEQSEIV